jgi:dihydrolipoamide dehydrogenase
MDYDVLIIGSGPAGYVAAIRAGQLGLKTALIEKSKIGGMCLNWGCIPTKAWLESVKRLQMVKNASSFGIDGINDTDLVFNWEKVRKRSAKIVQRLTKGVEYLLKKNGVEIIYGKAIIANTNSVKVENRLISTKNIIIATGSLPEKIQSSIPEKVIISLPDIINLDSLPQQPCVFGSGPHAIELAQFLNLAGKDAKLLVPDSVVLPSLDPFLSDFIKKQFKKHGIKIVTTDSIKGYSQGEVVIESDKFKCSHLINASKRQAVLPESQIDFVLANGFIKVNDFFKTNYDNIYAVGDVNGRSSFAHAASAQGYQAVNIISGVKESIDLDKIPINIYTLPEMAQLGMGEPEIKEAGIDYKVSEFPLSANGKALIEGFSEGLVRLISEKKYGEVFGVQIIAPRATDMVAEASVLMQLEGTVFDLAKTIHAHPTISEIFMEAGFAAFDQAIHK